MSGKLRYFIREPRRLEEFALGAIMFKYVVFGAAIPVLLYLLLVWIFL